MIGCQICDVIWTAIAGEYHMVRINFAIADMI